MGAARQDANGYANRKACELQHALSGICTRRAPLHGKERRCWSGCLHSVSQAPQAWDDASNLSNRGRASIASRKNDNAFRRVPQRKAPGFFFLPGYSPDLNPDELVWRQIKHHDIGRQLLEDADELTSKVYTALRSLQRRPKTVRSFFTTPTTCYAAKEVPLSTAGLITPGPPTLSLRRRPARTARRSLRHRRNAEPDVHDPGLHDDPRG